MIHEMVAMETAAILEILRNYDFFFWHTERVIFKIPLYFQNSTLY